MPVLGVHMARKAMSDSLRWTVFARDGFACRYCGRQAGQDGVVLEVDHVVSVADGGDNRMDNLVTACTSCNGGKSAKSLPAGPAPSAKEVQDRIARRRAELSAQAEAVARTIEAEKAAEQAIVNMKCEAFGIETTRFQRSEMTTARNLIREFGADRVYEWYKSAADHYVSEWKAVMYVCGCARQTRDRNAQGGAQP